MVLMERKIHGCPERVKESDPSSIHVYEDLTIMNQIMEIHTFFC